MHWNKNDTLEKMVYLRVRAERVRMRMSERTQHKRREKTKEMERDEQA